MKEWVTQGEPLAGDLILRLYVPDNGALFCCKHSRLRQSADVGSSQNYSQTVNQLEDCCRVLEVSACVRAVSGHGDGNATKEESVGPAHALDIRGWEGKGTSDSSLEVRHLEMTVTTLMVVENIRE